MNPLSAVLSQSLILKNRDYLGTGGPVLEYTTARGVMIRVFMFLKNENSQPVQVRA